MKPFYRSLRATCLALSLMIGGVAVAQPASAAPVIESSYVYYTKDGNGIYKNKIGGKTKETKITDDKIYGDIYVDGDWIYYMNITDVPSPSGQPQAGYVYKIKTTGKEKTQVTQDVVSSFGYAKGYVYYSYLGKKNADGSITRNPDSIFRVNSKGGSKKEILKETSYQIQVDGSYIYFVNEDEDGDLYKAKTDGKSKKQVRKDEPIASGENGFKVYEDWIAYFEEGDSTPKIMTTSGKDMQELDDDVEVVGFYKDDVYFTEDDSLYKKDAEDDDSRSKKVADLPPSTVNILAFDIKKEEMIIEKEDGTVVRLSFDDEYDDEHGEKKVKKLSLEPSNMEIEDGDTDDVSLIATYTNGDKENVTNKATWTSSKPSVAIFVGGKIKALRKGTTTIKASYGGKTDSIKVKVTK